MQLEDIVDRISLDKLFLRLKDVVENGEGWHDHETVYDHLIKTKDTALDVRDGDFIKDEEAKSLFLNWTDGEVAGMMRRDIIVITALVHDVGKILSFRENGEIKTLVTKKPTTEDQNTCPGHEYYGGTIVVPRILSDAGLDDALIKYISEVVTQHDALSSAYFASKENWTMDELMNDIKARAEGYYRESLFNMYCDGYTAPAFEQAKVKVEEVFSTKSFYTDREYFIE